MFNPLRVLAAGGLCAALAIASEASAGPAYGRDSLSTRIVRYTDTDLHTPAGARRLAERLRYAAEFVCGGDSVVIRSGSGFYRCRQSVLERAMAELNAPLVAAALHGGPEMAAR